MHWSVLYTRESWSSFTWSYFLEIDLCVLRIVEVFFWNSWCVLYPGVHCQCNWNFIPISHQGPQHGISWEFSLLPQCRVQGLGFHFWPHPSLSLNQDYLLLLWAGGCSFLLQQDWWYSFSRLLALHWNLNFVLHAFMCWRPCFICHCEHWSLKLQSLYLA